MVSRSVIIKEIKELIDANLSEWVDLQPIIVKHSAGLEFHQVQSVRSTIKGVLDEMKQMEILTYNQTDFSHALSMISRQRYWSDNLRVRSTMKYDLQKQKESDEKGIGFSFVNTGTIQGSAIGNTHSDLSNALANPTQSNINIQAPQPKTTRSWLEILAWIAGILAVVIPIMIYFKWWPFNK